MWLVALIFAIGPCPTEDSTGCYWDAQSQGNHLGTSFVSLLLPDAPLEA